MFRFMTERAQDGAEVEHLFDLCFAPGRTALSSYRLRDGVEPVGPLCLVARDDYDVLGGAIRFWPVRIGASRAPALLLGPVAVHPTRQGEGLGALLIAEGLGRAREAGWTRVLLVGDEPYYRRFGFSRETARGLDFPPPTNPDRLLARALEPDAWRGVAGPVLRWDAAADEQGARSAAGG
jgi:predicted N-acetyltransferase YhbS